MNQQIAYCQVLSHIGVGHLEIGQVATDGFVPAQFPLFNEYCECRSRERLAYRSQRENGVAIDLIR